MTGAHFTMPIHRTIKNVVKNYTFAEVKVREATSNDPWGPPTSLMAEIAQMTHDLLAYSEIIPMIWKRLNDHGKNWRHVYKSLVLLDYLVKAGSERVVQYCLENIVAIQTLKDFQHFEDGVDHGMNIREKAKQLVTLLKDPERLRNERSKAANIKNRFGISTGYALEPELRSSTPPLSSNVTLPERQFTPTYAIESNTRPTTNVSSRSAGDAEIESGRPSTTNEEDLQLQLALAMSKEEHDEEEKKRKGDEMKLQMAIEESKKTAQLEQNKRKHYQMPMTTASAAAAAPRQQARDGSHLLDWKSTSSVVDPWNTPLEPQKDPWSNGKSHPTREDRWENDREHSPVVYAELSQRKYTPEPAPWEDVAPKYTSEPAPWEVVAAKFANSSETSFPTRFNKDEFARLRDDQSTTDTLVTSDQEKQQNIEKWLDSNITDAASDDGNLWDMSELDGTKSNDKKGRNAKKVTPEEFLGPNAKLVDFNDLVSKPTTTNTVNPFALTINKTSTVNPFVAKAQEEEKSRRIPLNQLQPSTSTSPFGSQGDQMATLIPTPGLTVTSYPPPTLAVVYPTPGYNPFL